MSESETCTDRPAIARSQAQTGSDVEGVRHVFARLVGRWSLVRTMRPGGSFRGEAIVRPIGSDLLRYDEEGYSRLDNGAELKSVQRYLFNLVGNEIHVLFDERPPRIFHRFRLERAPGRDGLVGVSHHLCGSDDYHSRYEFGADGLLRIVHRVVGPRKEYVAETLYERRHAKSATAS